MANNHSPFLAGSDRLATFEGASEAVRDDETDAALALLGDSRRRAAVRVLLDAEVRTLDRRTLAHRTAATETDADASSDRRVRRVEIALHHKHLPMLDDAGVVTYDPDANLVTFEPSSDIERRIRAILE